MVRGHERPTLGVASWLSCLLCSASAVAGLHTFQEALVERKQVAALWLGAAVHRLVSFVKIFLIWQAYGSCFSRQPNINFKAFVFG